MTVGDLFRTLIDSGISLDTEIKVVTKNAETAYEYSDLTTTVVDYEDGTAAIIVKPASVE